MWQLFARNNTEYSVRRLAKRFHLSVKRVDAILRLKGMEQDWKKVCILSSCGLCLVQPIMMFSTISLKDNYMVPYCYALIILLPL